MAERVKYLVGFAGQYSVEPGQERDVTPEEAARLVERGLAVRVVQKKSAPVETAEAKPTAERATSPRGRKKK